MSRLFDVNVNGVFYTAREAARNMIPLGGGSIILIASMSANVSISHTVSLHRITFNIVSLDCQYTSGLYSDHCVTVYCHSHRTYSPRRHIMHPKQQ